MSLLLGEYFANQAARPLVAALTARWRGDEQKAADRVATAGSLILGVIMRRYVLQEGPLAHTDESSLAEWLGHNLQQLFTTPPHCRCTRAGAGRPPGDGS